MEKTERQQIIADLELAMLRDLKSKIDSGEASAADRALAWKICVDHGILRNMGLLGQGNPQEFLSQLPALPEFTE